MKKRELINNSLFQYGINSLILNFQAGIDEDIFSLDYDTIEDDFKDLAQFEIDGKIKIVKSIDYSTTDLVDDFTEIKTITVKMRYLVNTKILQV